MATSRFTHITVTSAGNTILAMQYSRGYQKLGNHNPPSPDLPLKNIKVKGRREAGWSRYERAESEGLPAVVRRELEKLGITTLGQLMTRRHESPVKTALGKVGCYEGRRRSESYMKMLNHQFPGLSDPNYIPPFHLDIGEVTLEDQLAITLRDLSKDEIKSLVEDISGVISEILPDMAASARDRVLAKREAELVAELAMVRAKQANQKT